MQLRWDDRNADIGVYELVLWGDDGKKIGSEVTLWDYTCEYQADTRKNILPEHLREIAFMFGWCDGWSHSETFKKSDNVTLEDVKNKAEQWLIQMYESSLESATKQVAELIPIVKFLHYFRRTNPSLLVDPHNLEISEATLLTRKEAEKILPERFLHYKDWWWLQSPGRKQGCAAFIGTFGAVRSDGKAVFYDDGYVRPALKIRINPASNATIGNRFIFGDVEFEIISDDIAFCVGDIGQSVFRKNGDAEDAKSYEASDIKKLVDSWFTKAKEICN